MREFDRAVGQLCRIIVYLMETRDMRRKGNKLAPEKLVFDALENLARELK